jgi:hypothetical protein
VSCLRENLTSSSYGEGLETGEETQHRASPLPDNADCSIWSVLVHVGTPADEELLPLVMGLGQVNVPGAAECVRLRGHMNRLGELRYGRHGRLSVRRYRGCNRPGQHQSAEPSESMHCE